ncbi:DNA-binding response regulator [Mesonia sp. K7]|nr:DNA-binding response regulator [Mesonia sp. K7]
MAKNNPHIDFYADYNNAVKAKESIVKNQIDLVFLDVEMPLFSGFDMLDSLEKPPIVIFITGKQKYALQAFEYKAIDFLQKPIQKNRFDKAVEKALEMHKLKHNYAQTAQEESKYIFVKSNFKNHKVYLNSIKYIEAFGDYVKVRTDNGSYTVLSTMKNYEKELAKDNFFRIHKSFIVNLNRVKNFSSKSVWVGEQEFPLSRNKKDKLKDLLENL